MFINKEGHGTTAHANMGSVISEDLIVLYHFQR
jgi:hypothetical protein